MKFSATKRISTILAVFAAVLCLSATVPCWAGGGQHYPLGITDFVSGALPPGGFYLVNNLVYGQKDRLVDNSGDELPVDFEARIKLFTTRVLWVSPYKLLGGQFGMHGLVPIYDVDVERGAMKFDDSGVGDMLISPFNVGWHFGPKWHALLSLDFMAPTGDYDKRNPATTILSKNIWTMSPALAVTYKEERFDAAIRFLYDFHTKNEDYLNPATGQDADLESGEEFHFDYSVGFVPAKGWRLGIVGYHCWQTTDDEIDGMKVSDARSRIASIGPAISYSPKPGLVFTLKHFEEYAARNTAEGYKTHLKMIYKF